MAPHQMLAAHVTEPVTPITNRRAAIPSALAELVMACLAKNPADRPQSADEILHLLDGIATPSGSQAITSSAATMRHLLRRPRNRALAFGAAAAMLLIGGWVALRPRSAAALDANRIAIAPFEVLGGTELGLWREGLVDVLSRSLDGAGPLRTASPTLVVRRWGGGPRADAQSAQALGQVTGSRTVVFGSLMQAGADSVRLRATVLDVAGKVVAPGFIDIHSHSDEAMFVNDALESALHMGVTLVVCGNCGGSSAPVSGLAEAELDRELARLDVKRTWSSFGEYAAAVDRAKPAINVCSFVGHGTLRSCVMGADARPPSATELERMRALLGRSMDEGAIGLASGLIYPPSAFGTTDELAALGAVVREKGGLYASHIRNESTRLLEAVAENVEIGRRAGVRVELSHHKAAGQSNWGKVRESTASIERARAEGVDVTADQYPYTASSTGLAVTIPNWVHEGGTQRMCERLKDPAVRERIRGEEVETGRAWDRIVIARARHHAEWAGKSVAELAAAAGRDPLEWSCDALVEHEGAVDIVHHSMSEDDVRYVMAKEWVCVGSDSRANAPYGPLSFGKPHPRSYGTFPRVLGRYARDEGVLSLPAAVHAHPCRLPYGCAIPPQAIPEARSVSPLNTVTMLPLLVDTGGTEQSSVLVQYWRYRGATRVGLVQQWPDGALQAYVGTLVQPHDVQVWPALANTEVAHVS